MSAADAYAFPFHLFAANHPDGIPSTLGDVRLEDLFDAWVFAARDAELALGAWASSQRDQRGEAHAVYCAALDREERAAAVLAAARSRQPANAGLVQ
jgi:hypothetical protein